MIAPYQNTGHRSCTAARWVAHGTCGKYAAHSTTQQTQRNSTPQCYTGALPPLDTLRDYDAVFITGSHYSVYERRAWISQLKAYLRLAILGRRVPVKFIGICFGCQVLADALGGRVGANPDGAFVCKGGFVQQCTCELPQKDLVHTVEHVAMHDAALQRCQLTVPAASIRLVQSHGDQVLQLPPDAVLLGTSPTAQHEVWTLDNRVLAIQGHPELCVQDVLEKILPAVRYAHEQPPVLCKVLISAYTQWPHGRCTCSCQHRVSADDHPHV